MVMTNQQMMEIMGKLQESLKRLGYQALLNSLTKLEKSPIALRELLELAKRAEETSDNSS